MLRLLGNIRPKIYLEEINQLYHPSASLEEDFQFVYSYKDINSTKFSAILLKEWFYLVKKNGYLVIDYEENERLDWKELEGIMWRLWGGKYEIIFHGSIKAGETYHISKDKLFKFVNGTKSDGEFKNGLIRFVCKKKKSLQISGDSIDKWTFGIVTRGDRDEWVEKIIESIKNLKIPKYQIIICGIYKGKKDKRVKYIYFNKRNSLGWITKKKNLIVDAASHENICIVHDRLIFDRAWYKGMKKWGNNFEHLGCVQFYNGERAGDWQILEESYRLYNGKLTHRVSDLDYRDWDEKVFISGNLHIGKKRYLKNAWDESLHWNEDEDVILTEDLKKAGIVPRFNPYSKTKALYWRFKPGAMIVFNPLLREFNHEGSLFVRFRRHMLHRSLKYLSSSYIKIKKWLSL